MSAQEFIADLLNEVDLAVQPLAESLASVDAFALLLADFGWTLAAEAGDQAISNAFISVSQAVSTLDHLVTALKTASGSGSDDQLANAIKAVVGAIQALVTVVRALVGTNLATLPSPLDQADFWKSFPEELVDALVYDYVEQRLPALYGMLRFLGIFSEESVSSVLLDSPLRSPYVKRSVQWDRIPKIVTQPQNLFADVYGWGKAFDHQLFAFNVQRLAGGFRLPAELASPLSDLDDYYDPGVYMRSQIMELRVPLYWAVVDDGAVLGVVDLSVVILPIPPDGSRTADPAGFVIFPQLSGQAQATNIKVSDSVDISLGGGFESKVIRAEIRPDGTNVKVPTGDASLSALARLDVHHDSPRVMLGNKKSSRLELEKAHVSLSANGPADKIDYKIEVGADSLKFVLDFGEGDGFLQKLLGGKPQTLDLSAAISWSNRTGFAFSGRSSLEVNMPVHLSIGDVISIDTIYLALLAAGNKAALQVALSGGLKIGPVAAQVERVGLQLELTPRARTDPPGNLGGLDLDFGFKPPNGLGLLIDAGVLTGGGYLSIDRANGRYAGVLQLSITQANLALTVIGLLDTRLPGGVKGYSFLLIIAAQFPRIQLGFGFALTGVGGLAGINRSIVVEALQTGVRNHSVDHILFPKNPVAEATQLISDLRTIFPPTEGLYVFGPMASIVWGTPTIIEAELGIILELPHPIRLIILGQLNAVLPDKKSAIVELHLDIVGVLEFAEKRLAIDATLHDSRLAAFNAYGDMALRLSWGDPPNFALAVGGLHPQFQAPPGFPTLRRLTVALGTGENPRLSLQTYLAVTSNTVQIGALAELYAEAGGFNIYGWIGFDVLIVSPFSFTANLSAGVALRRGTQVIASVHVSATLTGPDFWHSWGEASVSLLFFSVTVHFDATFGVPVPTEVEVTTPWDVLQAEIGKTANWSITPPPASSQVVTLTAPPIGEASPALLDPLGGLTLREKAVPLDRTLTKFGEGHLDQPQRFTIHAVTVGSLPAAPGSPLLDHFAPAQFEEMGDAEKLSRPSFERMQAGTTIASDAVLFNVQTGRVDTFTYETVVIDSPDQPSRQASAYTLSADHQTAALAGSAAARSSLRTSGLEKFAPSPTTPPLATLADEEYVIVDVVSLNEQAEIPIPKPRTKGAAYQALAQYLKQHPGKRGQLEVAPAHEVIKEGA